MSVHVFVFLLVVCLLLSLALLYRLDWFPLRPFASKGAAKRTTVQRLLKPRSPDDCPACHSSSTISAGVGPAPVLVRPWSEWRSIKDRGGRHSSCFLVEQDAMVVDMV